VPYWFDGNNLIGQTAAQARGDKETRRAFLKQLSNYAAGRGGRFLVFFDGDDPDCSMPPRGVQVRFSAPLSTDDAILHRLGGMQNPADVIVVTNDADLHSRCRNSGARTMDWAEFSSVMRRASSVLRRRSEKEDPVKVDEWIRYFGLDEDSFKK
jgi:predicted RNA-binding protein with PIN domain